RRPIRAQDDEVLDVPVRELDAAVDGVIPGRGPLRHAEPDGVRLACRGTSLGLFRRDPEEAVPVVTEPGFAVRGLALPRLDLLGRTEAAVGVARADQLQRVAAVALGAVGLV